MTEIPFTQEISDFETAITARMIDLMVAVDCSSAQDRIEPAVDALDQELRREFPIEVAMMLARSVHDAAVMRYDHPIMIAD